MVLRAASLLPGEIEDGMLDHASQAGWDSGLAAWKGAGSAVFRQPERSQDPAG